MSNNSSCEISPGLESFRRGFYFATYYVITPLYIVLGFAGNSLLLYAFNKQAKTEKAYGYQMMSTTSKTFEILCMTLYILSFKCFSGTEIEGVQWFMTNYPLMWFSAYLAIPLANAMITTSLYFSLSMTADRVFAMIRPFAYKNLNHRRHQNAAAVISVFVGFSSTIFDIWRFDPLPIDDKPGVYKIKADEEYLAMTVPAVLAQVRTFLRVGGLTCLIGLNVAMVVIFRRRSKKVGQLSQHDHHKDLARKEAEKSLIILTVWQSVFTTVANLPLIVFYVLAYTNPEFTGCLGLIVAPIPDLALILPDAVDFFVMIGVNRKLRHTVLGALPPVCGLGGGWSMTTVKASNSLQHGGQHRNSSAIIHA